MSFHYQDNYNFSSRLIMMEHEDDIENISQWNLNKMYDLKRRITCTMV